MMLRASTQMMLCPADTNEKILKAIAFRIFWRVLTEKMPVLFYDFYAINVDTVVFNLAILNDELLFTFEMTNKVF